MSNPTWMLDPVTLRLRLEDERRDRERRTFRRRGQPSEAFRSDVEAVRTPVINGEDFSTGPFRQEYQQNPWPARPPPARVYERGPAGKWHDVTQQDRIEALLQELVDAERKRALYAELERLTRGWRP